MVSLGAENLALNIRLSFNLLQHNSEARKLQVFGKKARLAQLVEHYEEEDGSYEG